MTIRWKVTALLAALFVVLGAAAIFVADRVLLPSFAELERSDADVAMRRIDFALDSTLDRLALSATGWGNWTDAYRFMSDHNHAFVSENFTVVGLKQLDVNLLMFVDTQGKVVTSDSIDTGSDRPLQFDFLDGGRLAADFPWRDQLRHGHAVRGLLPTNRGILLLAAAPVLDGYGQGPVLGMAVLGRLLTAAEIARIGAQAQADLSMLTPQAAAAGTRLVETPTMTQVYRTYDDLYGRPVLTLRVDVPRNITHRGNLAVRYALWSLAGAAVVILALLMWVLHQMILKPLARVTSHAVAIGQGRELTTRLDARGSDEIGVLSREFDRMVANVAESRAKLVDQSFQAGFAELAKGVLHNLGNAMTPISVRLSGIRSRLRAAPLDHLALAIAELRAGDAAPQRRADLQEFVLLASTSLIDMARSAGADVEVMTRQTGIVQSALAEQMRSTRNEHVIESVCLTDLVAQTLEVVPDSARQRLQLASDASLTGLGPVRVARTVLRLVLQNFIINAADAVREAGMVQGALRIAADVVHEDGRRQLHIVCSDDGIGIDPANLPRVFEPGFSTKSRETNFGIGLHWCANAIGALGGRIWAVSEGVGHGASMHLLLPFEAHDADSEAAGVQAA
ncbi:MAG TPA: CHASE4 domain-containing protein [Steroidobacteraceae bacterium]|jgi:sensor domain CHASE-containing protein